MQREFSVGLTACCQHCGKQIKPDTYDTRQNPNAVKAENTRLMYSCDTCKKKWLVEISIQQLWVPQRR